MGLCLASLKAAVKVSTGLHFFLELEVLFYLCVVIWQNSFPCSYRTEAFHLLAIGQRLLSASINYFSQLLCGSFRGPPTWQFTSAQSVRESLSPVWKDRILEMKPHQENDYPITFIIFYWLEESHRFSLNTRRGDYTKVWPIRGSF